MNRFLTKSAAGILLMILASGCTSMATQSSQDPNVDLTRYATFKIESKSQLPPHLSRRIEEALQDRLTAAGLSVSEKPELLVNFYTIVHDELKVTETSTPTLVRFRRGYTVWNTYETDVRQITEGTLLIDAIDTAANKLVWESSAHGLVARGNTERNSKKIEQAVAKMFATFPSTSAQEQ